MRSSFAICLVLWVLFALPGFAHLDDEELPEGADDIVVPEVISLLDFVRFTRVDHRLLLYRLDRGDTHFVAGLPPELSRAAANAGEINPRPTGRLVWEMSEITDPSQRAAYLAQKAEILRQTLVAMRADPNTAQLDLDTVRALLDLVTLWQQDPMAGAPK